MKIAVILVNYNGLLDTFECIDSIKKSSTNASIIVVDNASKKDETVEINKKYPDVETIRCETNLGFAGGNNIAIKKALDDNFDYIMLLNNDTIVEKNMIAALVQTADSNTVVLPNMFFYDYPNDLWYGGGKIHRILGKVSHEKKGKAHAFETDFATGCCIMLHNSIFERVGLLSEEYFMYCEDIDFSIRLRQAGVRIMVQPKAKLWHKVAKSSPTNGSAFRIYYNTRNRLLLVKKFKTFFSIVTFPYIYLSTFLKMAAALVKRDGSFDAFKKGLIESKS